ncbi:MAG: hypothetical protein AB8C95_03155 [Phycisphaeraceae bacterium]
MKIHLKSSQVCTALALALLLTLSPVAMACKTCAGHSQPVLIQRTIPDPYAVKRSPLTSDRFSTTSTRLIDARRGFRPYSSVYGDGASHQRFSGYDDHFGISRPENRPWSYSQRTLRTSVSQFRNDRPINTRSLARTVNPVPGYSLILREQNADVQPKADMKIRVHNDRSSIPTTTGAVLITADGTVIQIGD